MITAIDICHMNILLSGKCCCDLLFGYWAFNACIRLIVLVIFVANEPMATGIYLTRIDHQSEIYAFQITSRRRSFPTDGFIRTSLYHHSVVCNRMLYLIAPKSIPDCSMVWNPTLNEILICTNMEYVVRGTIVEFCTYSHYIAKPNREVRSGFVEWVVIVSVVLKCVYWYTLIPLAEMLYFSPHVQWNSDWCFVVLHFPFLY